MDSLTYELLYAVPRPHLEMIKKKFPKRELSKKKCQMKGTSETLIVTALSLVRVCNL